MRDTRQRMVLISLHAYLMLIAPLSCLSPRRPVTDHNIVLCLKAGLAERDGPWGPEWGVGECPVLTTGARAQHHRSPNHCQTTPPMHSPSRAHARLTDTYGLKPNTSVH